MRKYWLMMMGAAMTVALPASGSTMMPQSAACKPAGSLMRLQGLPEASGLVVSRSTPGRLWAHNDSGKPEVVALDTKGQVTGHVSIAGATLEDWEAMASATCGKRTCLYIADIGDNDASRKDVTIFRVPEPDENGGSAEVDAVFKASYPDGAHDAETLLASPDGTLYIVTKGDTGPVAVYRFPHDRRPGATVRLEAVGAPLSKGQPPETARVTDGAMSPDGAWVVLRTRTALTFYRGAEFLKGEFREVHRTDLGSLNEPQGEGVAFGSSGTVWVAGEGGGKSQPGTLAALYCAL